MDQTTPDDPTEPHPKTAPTPKRAIDKDAILSQIKVNTDLLSQDQQDHLTAIHTASMSGCYQNNEHPYLTTFSFRWENKAPPFRIWVAQFGRQCKDLIQAKCDQLEEQGVLLAPRCIG